MKKLENLISFDDFKSGWKASQASKTKRTETGLDILKENVEEIIPEGLPEESFNNAKYGMSTEEKIEEIKNNLNDENIQNVINYFRDVLLELEQMGLIDEDTTDQLDEEYEDWNDWVTAVLNVEELPEDALNGALDIINENIEDLDDFEVQDDEVQDDEDEDSDENDDEETFVFDEDDEDDEDED